MTIVVDPAFSVYHLVERLKQSNTMLSHRRTMSRISFEIENATLVDKARSRIFSGFQRMSKFIPQMKRYTQLAANAERVYVFGIPDAVLPPIPNITYVALTPEHQLSKEWFLVSHGLDYHSVLATEELTEIDDPDESRMFHGLWTFDLDMVKIIEEWLTSAVDAPPLNFQDKQYNHIRQAEIMSATMGRLLERQNLFESRTRLDEQAVRGEVKTLVKEGVQPELADLEQDDDAGVQTAYEREVVIFFSDIRNFTRLAEQFTPRDLVAQVINPYIDVVSKAITAHNGVIDKFLGDGLLAVFGLENEVSDAANQAVKAAVKSLSMLRRQHPHLPIGIGIASGKVLVGEIGTALVSDKTVIGDAVNVAQRLSSLGYNGIWISREIYSELDSNEHLESIGEFALKGKSSPQTVYRYTGQVS